MQNKLFIPKRLKVGYQDRDDTYTGKLAYVIYFDQHNKIRKEKSWLGWCDEKLGNHEYENVPTSGFVLNKKVGGYCYDWNPRQTYVRVYDPRGFEFEITIPNLLYILENTSSIKGKGLEGDFVYAWDGTELVLMPTDTPDYKRHEAFNAKIHAKESVKAKELEVGATYLTKSNEKQIYLGKYNFYEFHSEQDYDYTDKGEMFWVGRFYETYDWKEVNGQWKSTPKMEMAIEQVKSISGKFLSKAEDDPFDHIQFADKMMKMREFKPKVVVRDEIVVMTFEEFLRYANLERESWRIQFIDSKLEVQSLNQDYYRRSQELTAKSMVEVYQRRAHDLSMTMQQVFDEYKPVYIRKVFEDGTTATIKWRY